MTTQAHATYTMIATEQGNGLPSVGDLVLRHDDSGWHRIYRVIETPGDVRTGAPGQGNECTLICVDGPDYDDMTEEEQDEAYASLHHVRLAD